jgi:hypothetical protein
MDDKDYVDKIDITPDEFWKKFYTLKKLPTTATVSPGDFTRIFMELGAVTDSIVCPTVSKALTGAYQSAEIAREDVLKAYPGSEMWGGLAAEGILNEEDYWETGVPVSKVSLGLCLSLSSEKWLTKPCMTS